MSDRAVCAATLRHGSRSFAAAALLLPLEIRRHATALYSFCRVADDLVDAKGGDVVANLDLLHLRLDRAYAAAPADSAIDRAFAHTVAACGIPRAWPEALLEGFAWDAQGRRYADLAELRGYAARVAGTVGAMMALVMGVSEPDALARACDLGVAMQLSNIARDVAEDARAGRLYLPLDWLDAAGIDVADRLDPACPALPAVVRRVLDEAERLYACAEPGIALLPARCRPAIRAAGRLYREIGREVQRNGCNPASGRAVVPARRKLGLLAGSLFGPSAATDAPALAEAAFLLAVPARARTNGLVWVLELFARLDQRDAFPLA